MSAGSTTFTTAHRVINRVHNNTTVSGTTAQPAASTGFTGNLEAMVDVGNHTNGGAASTQNHTGFARRHLHGSVLALPRIMAALIENNQTPEGIVIPEVLRKYTNFDIIG